MRWPWVSRKRIAWLEGQVAALSDTVVQLRSEQAQADRRHTIMQDALKDRDAWAAKAQELEDRQDALINAAVERALALIQSAHDKGASKQN